MSGSPSPKNLLKLLAALLVLAGGALWVGSSLFAVRSTGGPGALDSPPAPVRATVAERASDLRAPEAAAPLRTRPREAAAAPRNDEPRSAPASAGRIAPDDGPRIRGRIIDPHGNPQPGARVAIARWSEPGPVHLEFRSDRPDPDVDPERWVQGDEAGRFEIAYREQFGNLLALHVRARGSRPHSERIVADPGRGTTDVGDIAVQPGLVLQGFVVDDGGVPVAGARVTREEEGASPTSSLSDWVQQFSQAVAGGKPLERGTESDEHGAFELAEEAPGRFELVARHPRFPEARLTLDAPHPGVHSALVLRFPPAARISGRIAAAPLGTPEAEGLMLGVRHTDRPRSSGMPIAQAFSSGDVPGDVTLVELATDGSFLVEGLGRGERVELFGVLDRGLLQREACTERHDLVAPAERVELTFLPGATLLLRVVDGEQGTPVERMSITREWGAAAGPVVDWVRATASRMRKPVPEDVPDGAIRLRGVRSSAERGALTLILEAEGYLPWERRGITVPSAGTLDLGEARLERSPRLLVRVLEATTQAPVRNARVRFRADAPTLAGAEGDADEDIDELLAAAAVSGKTNRAGEVELAIPPTAAGELRVSASGYATVLRQGIAVVRGAQLPVVVEVERAGEVEVRATDVRGAPVPGVRVERARGARAEVEEARGTDEAGVALFRRLAPGRHGFRAMRFEGGPLAALRPDEEPAVQALSSWCPADVVGGERVRVRIVVAGIGSLEGRISSAVGPLGGATVSLLPSDGEPLPAEVESFVSAFLPGRRSTQTDTDGRYAFAALPARRFTYLVTHPDHVLPERGEIELVEGRNQLDVHLESAAVTGRVVDERGLAVVRARVIARPASEEDEEEDAAQAEELLSTLFGGRPRSDAWTKADGSYELDGLPADVPLRIEVRAQDFLSQRSAAVTLRVGEIKEDVDLVLTRGGTLEVSLDAPDEFRFEMIHARNVNDRRMERSVFASGRRATLRGLAAGEWNVRLQRVSATGVEELVTEERVTITAGEVTNLVLRR